MVSSTPSVISAFRAGKVQSQNECQNQDHQTEALFIGNHFFFVEDYFRSKLKMSLFFHFDNIPEKNKKKTH